MKSGKLNFLEPSGPLQACDGTAYLRLTLRGCEGPSSRVGRFSAGVELSVSAEKESGWVPACLWTLKNLLSVEVVRGWGWGGVILNQIPPAVQPLARSLPGVWQKTVACLANKLNEVCINKSSHNLWLCSSSYAVWMHTILNITVVTLLVNSSHKIANSDKQNLCWLKESYSH